MSLPSFWSQGPHAISISTVMSSWFFCVSNSVSRSGLTLVKQCGEHYFLGVSEIGFSFPVWAVQEVTLKQVRINVKHAEHLPQDCQTTRFVIFRNLLVGSREWVSTTLRESEVPTNLLTFQRQHLVMDYTTPQDVGQAAIKQYTLPSNSLQTQIQEAVVPSPCDTLVTSSSFGSSSTCFLLHFSTHWHLIFFSSECM